MEWNIKEGIMQFIENVSMAAIIKGDHYLDENKEDYE